MVVVSDLGPPQEGVRHTQPAVATFVNRFSELRFLGALIANRFSSGNPWGWERSTSLRPGSLGWASKERYSLDQCPILKSKFSFWQGFSLEYKHVALHAVSRDLTQFHQECLYLMIGSDDLLLVEIRNGGIIVESCQM